MEKDDDFKDRLKKAKDDKKEQKKTLKDVENYLIKEATIVYVLQINAYSLSTLNTAAILSSYDEACFQTV